MTLDWIVHPESPIKNETHVCSHGIVVKVGAEGWSAFAYLPRQGQNRDTTIEKHLGDCYKTATGARAAVSRFLNKYSPLEAK